MSPKSRLVLGAVLVGLSASLGGCQQWLMETAVEAPNFGVPFAQRFETDARVLGMIGVDRELFVPIADPPAMIRAWVIEPDFTTDGRSEPRGTILVLHGLKVPSFWMLVKGRDLADVGYRVVMVDSRGHGGSTGSYVTFGVQESRDLVEVIDALERERLVAGRLGVWGISLGAATAIQLAARDPRVDAVVAVTPYTTFRAAATNVTRRLVAFNDRWSDAELDDWIDRAGRYAGFDPDAASPIDAIASRPVHTLIIGGRWDAITPIEHARALHAAAPDTTELIELPATGHIFAGVDLGWRVKRESIAWFDRYLFGRAATFKAGNR